jgi:alpha-beta hydrolase superfamily lysophospholipase
MSRATAWTTANPFGPLDRESAKRPPALRADIAAVAIDPAQIKGVLPLPLHSQAKVNTADDTRGPLLLISGTADHTVPDVVTRSTLKQYRDSTAITELKQFEGRGHSLAIDSGADDVIHTVLD